MNPDAANLLRGKNLRATPARIAVLAFLQTQKFPVGIQKIKKAVPGKDLVTLYRIMEDFVEKGIVVNHDIGHGHADYELADRPHHHHVVCDSCGTIEDIVCEGDKKLNTKMLKQSKKFKDIIAHHVTFKGICKSCV